jgi:hypothetical protein
VTADESVKSTWDALFLRRGGSGPDIRIWKDWDDESRADALQGIDLQSEELAVIVAKSTRADFIVLTTRRLFWLPDVVAVQDITWVSEHGFREKKRKQDLNEMNVELRSGERLRLSTASGPSYFAFWNVLLHIARANSRRRLSIHMTW